MFLLFQIVSHIALVVKDMAGLRKKLSKLNVKSRKNVSVPNPAIKTAVDQVKKNILEFISTLLIARGEKFAYFKGLRSGPRRLLHRVLQLLQPGGVPNPTSGAKIAKNATSIAQYRNYS